MDSFLYNMDFCHDRANKVDRKVTWHQILHLHLQKIHVHQITEGANLPWEARTMKATWPFDHVTNVGSRDNLRNLYFHFQKSYGH